MKLTVIQEDITRIEVDAIVNAANSSLLGGGGVDGAIHRAGGPYILDECRMLRAKQGKCKVGETVVTTAGKLKAKKVIHTVGPFYHEKNKGLDEKLANCYQNSLGIAVSLGLKTLAFPNISTGIYKFPKEKAAEIAISTVQKSKFLKELDEVVFVCLDNENYRIYKELLSS